MINPQSDKALMNKVEALQKEFAEIDINHDANISRDELYSYLDRKTKSRFDRAIADELFDHMDKDQNQFVTINEFIRVYIEADEMLQKKIATAKANLINYKRQQEEYSKKAQEERAVEKPNQYGIANDSAIYVTVVEASFTNAMAAPSNPYVEISLDDQQRVRTRVVQGGKQPMWDEKVTLDVFNPGSILRFIVFESRNVGDDAFAGEIAVEINDLQDQNLHDVTLNLFDQRANNEIGTLHLNLQWIHSKATYFENLAQKWIETYRNEEEELKEYERYLANLYQPFPTLLMPQNIGSGTQAPLGGSQPAPTTLLDRKILAMMNQAARNITQDHPSDVFWKGLLTLLCQVEIILAILIGFGRATFVDLLLTILVFLELRKEIFRNVISLKQMALGILLSAVVLDIVWLWTYSGNWTNVESFDVDAEGGTRSFVVFFSYVNVIVKLIFSVVCYTFSLHGH